MIEPIIGHVYRINHSSGIINARFLQVTSHSPYARFDSSLNERRTTKRYDFVNLRTNKRITLKSRVKILSEVTTG